MNIIDSNVLPNFVGPSLRILITLLEEEPRLLPFLVISLAFDLLPILLFVVVVRVETLGEKLRRL